MANWQGPTHTRRQDVDGLSGQRPRRAYFILLGNGRYSFGVGDPTEEAAVAIDNPIASAPSRVTLDSNLSVPHHQPILVGASRILL